MLRKDYPELTDRLAAQVKGEFPPREVIPRLELEIDPPVPGGMFVPLRFVERHTPSVGDAFTLLIGHDDDATVTGGCLVLTDREVRHAGPLSDCVRGRIPEGERVIELFDPRRHVHFQPHRMPWEGPEPVNAHRLIGLIEARRWEAVFDPTTWHEAVARCIERRGADLDDLRGILAQSAPEFAWSLQLDWLVERSTWERADAHVLRRVGGVLDVSVSLSGDLDLARRSLDVVAADIARMLLFATAHRARVELEYGDSRTAGWSERIYLEERR